MTPTSQLVDDDARTITCPRCEQAQPMRDFATLGMSPRYAWLLSPIYRCKQCNHLFAPREQQMSGAGAAAA
jgi:rubredoxin